MSKCFPAPSLVSAADPGVESARFSISAGLRLVARAILHLRRLYSAPGEAGKLWGNWIRLELLAFKKAIEFDYWEPGQKQPIPDFNIEETFISRTVFDFHLLNLCHIARR